MSDPIDRQAIIGFANELEQRALKLSNNDSEDILYKTVRVTIKAICEYCEKLPSVQPEIIRCKDCKDYQEGVDINGKPFSRCNGSVRTYGHTMPDWHCADAERR